jgi:cytoskeletal protein RodZ
MDKKSFFRGFGVGVLFAAVILGISFVVRTSDPYVTSRAKELGMVYQTEDESEELALAKESASPTPEGTAVPTAAADEKETKKPSTATKKPSTATKKPSATAAPTKAATATKKPSAATEKPSATAASKKASTAKDTKKELEEEKKKIEQDIRQEQKKLTINAGEWSSDVSKKLEDLGVVSDATDFDKYLNDNGYSSIISAGTYDVSIGESYAELARKITKQ